MATTEFEDSQHYGLFMTGTKLNGQTGKYVRVSALVLAALRAAGLLDRMVDGTTPPATDKLWLDKNLDPPVLKEWEPIGSNWAQVTFERVFERVAPTVLTVVGGTANAITVAQPSVFISHRLYILTPNADNTGAVTIAVTGVGTFPVKYPDGTDLNASELAAGKAAVLIFQNSRFEVILGYGLVANRLRVDADQGLNPTQQEQGRDNLGLGTAATADVADFATPSSVAAAVAALVDSAPATLDTLNELAAALGDDPNFATTVSTALGNRVRVDTAAQGLNGTQQQNARTNMGLGTAATQNTSAFATSAQGALADTAMQPGAFGIGVPNSSSSALVANIDDSTIASGEYSVTGATTGTFPAGATVGTLKVERYSGGWVKQTLTYRADAGSGALATETFIRTYNAGTSAWRAWERVATAENLRNPPSTITSPLMHFERSIPLNLWECGVSGHDTSPADETAGILAAIDRAIAEKRDLAIPATLYKCNTIAVNDVFQLRMYGVGGKPFFLPGDTLLANGGDLFEFTRPNGSGYDFLSSAVAPTSDVIVNEDGITFASSVSAAVGKYLGITSDKEWYYDGRGVWWKGEMHEIYRVGGNTVLFKDATCDAYDISAETLTIAVWTPSRLEMHNIGFGSPSITTPYAPLVSGGVTALAFNRCKRAVLDDIEIYGFSGPQISQRNNDGTRAHNIRCWLGGTDGEIGYGMAHLGCINEHATDIQGGGMRRLIDFSGTGNEGCGPSRNCIVDGFHAHGGGRDGANVEYEPHGAKPSFGVGTHGPAENITFKNGKITNVGSGVTVRGRNTVLQNIEFYGWILDECISATYGEGLIVENCSYTSNDFGQKEAQGVALDGSRRANDFIAFGNSNSSNRWKADDLPTILTNNKFDGLRRSFMVMNAGQGTVFRHLTLVDNTGEPSAASGEFLFITNLTGGNVGLQASDVWGNLALPRDDSGIGCEFNDGTVYLGHRSGASLDQDRVCRVGPRSYRLVISNGSYYRIKDMELYLAGYTQRRITVTGLGDNTIHFDGWIVENSATPVVIYQGSNIEFSATPTALDGDGGTTGKLTIGMTTSGALWVENRRGGNRDIEITVG